MEAFYVTIIFLGVILVAVSLFLIIMDRVNGKDFFKEFDRKKDEMFNLIQDSEEMVHELNRMSDYVVTVIEEKNQEFFNKMKSMEKQEKLIPNKKGKTVSEPEIRRPAKETEAMEKMETYEASAQNLKKDSVQEHEKSPQMEKATATPLEPIIPSVQKSVNIESYKNFTRDKVQGNKLNTINEDNEILDNNPDIENSIKPDKTPEVNSDKEPVLESTVSKNTTKLVLNNRRKEVLQLIEQGFSNDEIAEKMKIGKGEIGLIRGLSNSK